MRCGKLAPPRGVMYKYQCRRDVMLVDLAFGLLMGALVGLRYRVVALLPIVALVVGFALVRAVLEQATVLSLVGAATVSLLGTQIGYLCAAAVRQFCRK